MVGNFDKAFELVLLFEGGYSNDRNDSGGETKFGISKRAYPSENIADLTEDRAKEIYLADYWQKSRCSDLPYPIDLIHFDAAVNCGVKKANILLQISINERRDNMIKVDGTIGNQTLEALTDPERIANNYLFNRVRYYVQLNKPVFLAGWINRILSLRVRI